MPGRNQPPASEVTVARTVEGIFTVDVEDYYQVTAFEKYIQREDWGTFESRVEANTHRILDLLARHDVRGTFFVLGWVAQRHPQLVRDISNCGHEIGSHTFWHRLIYNQTPEDFRSDVRESRDLLQELTGQSVLAFRAPTFSITSRSLWALDILAEEGFRIDSSIFPIHHDRYGIPDGRDDIHCLDTPAGRLWEFPPTVTRIGRFNLPVGGGGYFRLYPYHLTQHYLSKLVNQRQQPFMFYIHPWDLDADQPRLEFGSRATRFRHYVNLGRTADKLERLLKQFRFGRISDVILTNALDPSPTASTSSTPTAAS